MKKILSLILTICLIISICVFMPLSASAATSGTCGDDLTWTLDDKGTLTISGTGDMDSHWSRGIMPKWYKFHENIINIYIEDGVTNISNFAFAFCFNAKCITMPNSLSYIGISAFQGCKSLEKVIIPQKVKQIDRLAFAGCDNIQAIFIPKTLTQIDDACFGENHAKSIEDTNAGGVFRDMNHRFNIYYEGNESLWENINISNNYNKALLDSPVSFNSFLYDVENHITIYLNEERIVLNPPTKVVGGRTLVPLRAIFESMGTSVEWNDSTKTVTSKLGDTTIQLTIGNNLLYKNGTAIALDVPAQLINGYTMVPLRAVAEAFGADVGWDGDTQTVYITTKGNTYSVNTVPQIIYDGYNANFADFNGMYIDSFTHKTNSNGTENVKFDVYNTEYIYGLVEIYNANGDLTDVAIIDKMSNSTSIKGVLIDDTGSLIRDIWRGTALTYRQESGYSKKTSININIPKGGYIKITNDMSESFIASAINLSDMVFAAKSTFSTLSGFNSDTSKDFVYELSLKLINETAFAETIKTPKKFTDKLWKGVGEELYMNSESVGGFLDTVSKNLDEFADGELAELVISTATNCGIGIAEGTFGALAGPAGVALKAIFTITSVNDVLIEMNDGLDCLYQGSISINAN